MPAFESPSDANDPLSRLLLEAVPPDKRGIKTLTHMAKLLKVSRWALHKWIIQQKIGPDRVMQIVEVSKIEGYDDSGKPILGNPRVHRNDFDAFVYKTT